ncbi:Copper-transporting ATPase 1, partial [Sarcoptes scabiei]
MADFHNESIHSNSFILFKIPGISCNKCIAKIMQFFKQHHPDILNLDLLNPIDADFVEKKFKFFIRNSSISPKQLKILIESIDPKFSCSLIDEHNSSVQLEKSKSESDKSIEMEIFKKISSNDSIRRKCLLSVQGMSCSSCADKIVNKLNKTNGIISCHIGLITAQADIDFDPTIIDPNKIMEILESMGYDTALISELDSNQQAEIRLIVMGITHHNDALKIKQVIETIHGVASIQIEKNTGKASIIYYPNSIGPRTIADKIVDLGFTVHTINSFDPESFTSTIKKEIAKWRRSFMISLIFGLPTMIVMIYFMYIMPLIYDHQEYLQRKCCLVPGLSLENLILFCLSTPVQIFGAKNFYIQAIKSLRNYHLSMDVLIMLATTIAYIYSLCVVIYFMITVQENKSPMTFFDTPPMLLVFISLGRWSEHLSHLRTTEYIVNLMSLRPDKATLLEVDRKSETEFIIKNERIIDVDLVQKNDLLRIRPGERIPTDGRMIVGEAMINESFINGESMPVAKKTGSLLLGGSIVSNGSVIMIATNVGADSQLCQIVKMVNSVHKTKAPIQQLADRISSFFIPFVIVASIISLIVWLWLGPHLFETIISLNSNFYDSMTRNEVIIQFAFQIALSVMVISCPCALGIATPSAVIIGAMNGIHIKKAESLEIAHKIDTIIFDKTGTLTYGQPSVTNLKLTVKFSSQILQKALIRLIALIGIAEANSDHPIAVSLVNYVRKALKIDSERSFAQQNLNFKLEAGLGIRCQIVKEILDMLVSSLETTQFISFLETNNISNASFIDNNKMDPNDRPIENDQCFEANQYDVIIGNGRWMLKNNIELSQNLLEENELLESQGETVFFVAVNGKIFCLISVSDTIKPEAKLAIFILKNRYNLDVMLLTGDNARSALAIGRKVGIEHIYAELLPQQKMDKARSLQSIGKKVAMVGDGINDAPALAQADLGIAISKGTDITIESADVVLKKDDLIDIINCIDLSRKTFQRIRINFLLAFLYNLLFIPIAAGVLIKFRLILQPWMSGACMALSSISVSCSSLLLRRYRKPERYRLEKEFWEHQTKSDTPGRMIFKSKNLVDNSSIYSVENFNSNNQQQLIGIDFDDTERSYSCCNQEELRLLNEDNFQAKILSPSMSSNK